MLEFENIPEKIFRKVYYLARKESEKGGGWYFKHFPFLDTLLKKCWINKGAKSKGGQIRDNSVFDRINEKKMLVRIKSHRKKFKTNKLSPMINSS